jgi:putative MATE family efflux protein
VLADTAIVGHLGRAQIAALGIAAAVLTTLYGVFNFLAYGTTAQVARYDGAGRRSLAESVAAQALWVSLGVGLALAALVEAAPRPLVALMGGHGRVGDLAVEYLRLAAIGLPFALVALAGQGCLRGVANLRTPLVVVVAGNVLNLVLEVVLVYGLRLGIRGSAWGTAVAQAAMGAAFVALLLHAAGHEWRPVPRRLLRLLRTGGHIFVRTASLLAAFAVGTAVVARFGDASLGAHQVAFQLWSFLALLLDSVAIASQVIVGRSLGAGDAADADAAAVRMIALSVAAGAAMAVLLLAARSLVPRIFTGDAAVLGRIAAIWTIFALMQPLNGAVFALDGILIGASDSSYIMWSMLAAGVVFAGVALGSLAAGFGLVGVWIGILVLICVRLVLMGARFRGRRWLVTGAVPGEP